MKHVKSVTTELEFSKNSEQVGGTVKNAFSKLRRYHFTILVKK